LLESRDFVGLVKTSVRETNLVAPCKISVGGGVVGYNLSASPRNPAAVRASVGEIGVT
jgi:hypothetical protein